MENKEGLNALPNLLITSTFLTITTFGHGQFQKTLKFLFFFIVYLFIFERERKTKRELGRGREKGRKKSQAGSTLSAQSWTLGLTSQTMRS